MNTEFTYFVDHLPSIITAIFSGVVMIRQAANTRTMTQTHTTAKQIIHDLHNGVGEKIAAQTVEAVRPVIANMAEEVKEAAIVAAVKIEKKADEVASALIAVKPDSPR